LVTGWKVLADSNVYHVSGWNRGFRSADEIAKLPGVRVIDASDATIASAGTYAFSRETTQRNLYRIPIP
jgi:hypothetical protein